LLGTDGARGALVIAALSCGRVALLADSSPMGYGNDGQGGILTSRPVAGDGRPANVGPAAKRAIAAAV